MGALAQGWYRDPYGEHQDRYFSAGWPTRLVRDGDTESYDPPPPRPLADVNFTPVPAEPEAGTAGADLLRAGQPQPDSGRRGQGVIDQLLWVDRI
jgi:hypothetical protein